MSPTEAHRRQPGQRVRRSGNRVVPTRQGLDLFHTRNLARTPESPYRAANANLVVHSGNSRSLIIHSRTVMA